MIDLEIPRAQLKMKLRTLDSFFLNSKINLIRMSDYSGRFMCNFKGAKELIEQKFKPLECAAFKWATWPS